MLCKMLISHPSWYKTSFIKVGFFGTSVLHYDMIVQCKDSVQKDAALLILCIYWYLRQIIMLGTIYHSSTERWKFEWKHFLYYVHSHP
jgi:hypothetical protein